MKTTGTRRPHAKHKDTTAHFSTMLLPLLGCSSPHMSEALLSLSAEVGREGTSGITSSDLDSGDFKLHTN